MRTFCTSSSSASVRTFCTSSRRPAGPLAPPTRRARLRSRWRSRYGGASAGWLAQKAETLGVFDAQQARRFSCGAWCPCSRCRYCPGRAEPVKSAFGVGYADLRLLTEPARKSRSSQLSGAGTRVTGTVGPGDANPQIGLSAGTPNGPTAMRAADGHRAHFARRYGAARAASGADPKLGSTRRATATPGP